MFFFLIYFNVGSSRKCGWFVIMDLSPDIFTVSFHTLSLDNFHLTNHQEKVIDFYLRNCWSIEISCTTKEKDVRSPSVS